MKTTQVISTIIIFFSTIMCAGSNEGFLQGTLVKVPSGYTAIEQLKKNDIVYSYDSQNNLVHSMVSEVLVTKKQAVCHVSFGDKKITTLEGQQFGVIDSSASMEGSGPITWPQAKELSEKDFLLSHTQGLIAIEEVIELSPSMSEELSFYALSLNNFHNYFVTTDDILVHNVVLEAAAVAASVAAAPVVGTAIAVAAGVGFVFGYFRSSKRLREEAQRLEQSKNKGPSNGKDPKRPPEDKAQPVKPGEADVERIHEPNPAHHKNSTGDKSPPPADGQDAVNKSLAVPGDRRRIAIIDNRFVVLALHRVAQVEGKVVEYYHAYESSWKRLDDGLQRALMNAGKATSKGKILP